MLNIHVAYFEFLTFGETNDLDLWRKVADGSVKPSAYKKGCLPQNYCYIHERTVQLEERRLFFVHMPSGERHQYVSSCFGDKITSTKLLLRTDTLEIVGMAPNEPEQIRIGDKSLEIASWLGRHLHGFGGLIICRTFRLTLLPDIQPFHMGKGSDAAPGPSSPSGEGQSANQLGQVDGNIFGTPCQANREAPFMYTASPDRSRKTSQPFPSSWLTKKRPSQPKLTLIKPTSQSSLTSRWTLRVSPAEYKFRIAAWASVCGNAARKSSAMSCGKGGGASSG